MQNEFGKLLRTARQQSGQSLRVLAAHLGVSVPYLSDVERGRRDPLTFDRIYKAAEFLNQDSSVLIRTALRSKSSFELSTNVSEAALETAVTLIKRWDKITDAQHRQIQRIFAGVFLSNYSSYYTFKDKDGNIFTVKLDRPVEVYEMGLEEERLKLWLGYNADPQKPEPRRFRRLEFSEGNRQWFEYHESPPCSGPQNDPFKACCKNSPLYREE